MAGGHRGNLAGGVNGCRVPGVRSQESFGFQVSGVGFQVSGINTRHARSAGPTRGSENRISIEVRMLLGERARRSRAPT